MNLSRPRRLVQPLHFLSPFLCSSPLVLSFHTQRIRGSMQNGSSVGRRCETPFSFGNSHCESASSTRIARIASSWLEMQDPSGRTMYYNPTSGKTSWARPVVRQLPPGWVKSQTPDGKTIFLHPETQRCSFEWPEQPQPAQMPQLSRNTTTTEASTTNQKPALVRSQTVPAQPSQKAPLLTVGVNAEVARRMVPGVNEALAVHQLAQQNNSAALTQKFNSDLAHTTAAL